MGLSILGSLTQVLPIEDESQVGHARRCVQRLAEQQGFDATDAGRAALLATELASNLLKHAGRGELHLRVLPNSGYSGLELIAIDRGAGFDLHHCLADGFSTGGTQGIGLGAIKRLADVFDVYADSRGAAVLARLYPRSSAACDLRWGASQHSLHHDPACGDAWYLAYDGQRISALVVDGLGHGELAERAAHAGTQAFAQAPFADPAQVLEAMHVNMQGTRGGAAAFAQYDNGALRFSGVGNIGAHLLAPGSSRGLASHPGIVGGQFRRVRPFDYADVHANLLVLYSDGLQSRWDLQQYPGLMHQHPALIAAVLHRDFCRGRDDITVLVVALETLSG